MSEMDHAGFGPMHGVCDEGAVTVAYSPRLGLDAVLFRGMGTFLVMTAAAMWFLPGSQTDADLIVMKLGVSLFFLLCGVALLMLHDGANRPAACFDPIRRELRVMAMAGDGRVQTVLRRSYASLGRAQFRGRAVELYDMDGARLMRLNVQDAGQRAALHRQLSRLMTICN
ncbi:MAG: hypothetical protein AB7S99_14370 [Pseudodonghicola sp.]